MCTCGLTYDIGHPLVDDLGEPPWGFPRDRLKALRQESPLKDPHGDPLGDPLCRNAEDHQRILLDFPGWHRMGLFIGLASWGSPQGDPRTMGGTFYE